jgi:hypothetical protein
MLVMNYTSRSNEHAAASLWEPHLGLTVVKKCLKGVRQGSQPFRRHRHHPNHDHVSALYNTVIQSNRLAFGQTAETIEFRSRALLCRSRAACSDRVGSSVTLSRSETHRWKRYSVGRKREKTVCFWACTWKQLQAPHRGGSCGAHLFAGGPLGASRKLTSACSCQVLDLFCPDQIVRGDSPSSLCPGLAIDACGTEYSQIYCYTVQSLPDAG